MATSLSYSFQGIDVDTIIKEAYERCGIVNALENGLYYESANRSGNFLFSSWINEGLNLFTVEPALIQIVPGQFQYLLPSNTSKILECTNANANRILGGLASSSAGGVAANAFDANINTACTQTAPNGNISYLFSTGTPVNYVGILSANTNTYKLAFECSFLNTPSESDWITVLQTPSVNYYFGDTVWYELPFTKSTINWRIRETNGATLNIAELYFDIPYRSITMKGVGRDSYKFYSKNSQTGASNTYWLNRIGTPTLNVYPTPDSTWQFFAFNRVRYIQDLGDFLNTLDTIPAFLDPLAAGLAMKVAEKFKPERLADLTASAEKAYLKAGRENTENVNLQVIMGMENQ